MNISFNTYFNYHTVTVNLCGKSRWGFVCLISIPLAQTKALDEFRPVEDSFIKLLNY